MASNKNGFTKVTTQPDALRKWYAQKTVRCEVWHLLEQRFFSSSSFIKFFLTNSFYTNSVQIRELTSSKNAQMNTDGATSCRVRSPIQMANGQGHGQVLHHPRLRLRRGTETTTTALADPAYLPVARGKEPVPDPPPCDS